MDATGRRHVWSSRVSHKRLLPALLVSAIGIAVSLATFGIARHNDKLAIQADLNLAAEDVSADIRGAVTSQLLILDALVAFHEASVEVERHEFTVLARTLLARRDGIQALDWVPRVPASERAAYEARAQSDGLAGFRFTERREQGDMVAADQRDEYFPVYYMEPHVGNEAALGFDLASEPSRLAALSRARDSGIPQATERILLAQETGRRYGLRIAVPIYRKMTPTDTVASRRANLEGFMLGVVRIDSMVSAALSGNATEGVLVHLFDRSAPADRRLLFCRGPDADEGFHAPGGESDETTLLSGMHHVDTIEVAGRQWSIVCTPTPEFVAARQTLWPWAMLATGLLLTTLLTGYHFVAARHAVRLEEEIGQRRFAENQRRQKEAALLESESRFRRLVESVTDYAYTLHVEGGQLVGTHHGPGCLTVTGYSPEDYLADGNLWFNMVHPDDCAAVQALCDELRNGTPRAHVEHRIVHKDGTTRWIENTLVECRDERGRAVGYDGLIRDVTDRRHAEEINEWLSRFPSENPAPVLRLAADGTVLYANRAGTELLAAHASGAGRPAPEAWRRLADMARDSGRVERHDILDGRRILEFSLVSVPNADYVNIYGIDITQIRRAEAALLQSEAILNRTGRMARIGGWEHDLLTGEALWTQALYDIIEIDPDQRLPGVNEHLDYYPPKDRETLEKAYNEAVANGTPFDLELQAHTTTGRTIWCRTYGEPVFVDGQCVKMRGTLQDITETRRAREALRSSEARYRALADGAPVGIYETDTHGNCVYVNRAWCEMAGIEPEEAMGRGWVQALHPEDRGQLGTAWQRFANGEGPWDQEYRFHRPDGRVTRVYGTARAIRNSEGTVTGYIGINLDVTARRQMEQQFRQSQKMEAVGRLAGGVAHDFRNQLTIIRGYAEMLGRRTTGDDEEQEMIDQILQAVQRSANMTGQLLAFSRQDVLQPTTMRVGELVRSISKTLLSLIEEDIEMTLLDGAGDCLVRVDPGQFHQAVINLTNNARDAMPGGGKLTIRMYRCDADGNAAADTDGTGKGRWVAVSVCDTGSGMDPEMASKAFEPFFTTKEVGQGTGLGLAMVHGFVTQSGGAVGIESRPGEGTTVSLRFPIVRPVDEPATGVDEATPAARGDETILVVEDEEPVRRTMVLSLREAGYAVLEAGNAQEAMDVAGCCDNRIDMLMTDVVMPGLSGGELADCLHETQPGLAVLFVSGYPGDALSARGLDGGLELLVKPFDRAQLLGRVRQVLDEDAASRP